MKQFSVIVLIMICGFLLSSCYNSANSTDTNAYGEMTNIYDNQSEITKTDSDMLFETNYSNPNYRGDDFYEGNYICYGCFCGEPLIWQVLEVDNNRALLFLNDVLRGSDGRPYRITFSHDDEYITWENSYIRTWLNNEFYSNAFGEDNTAILLTSIPNEGSEEHYLSFDDTIQETYYIDYQSEGGDETNDYIYLLSQNEIIDYFDGVENINGSTWTFYLRTPACNNHSVLIADVPANDFGPTPVLSAGDGIRPAMWVNIDYWESNNP